MPRSRPRRASSLKAMIFGMGFLVLPYSGWMAGSTPATDGLDSAAPVTATPGTSSIRYLSLSLSSAEC
jgi:hypothetical protein